jgi:hypothetical protein
MPKRSKTRYKFSKSKRKKKQYSRKRKYHSRKRITRKTRKRKIYKGGEDLRTTLGPVGLAAAVRDSVGGGAAGATAGAAAGGGSAGGGGGGGSAGGGPTTTAVGAAKEILGITDSAALTKILSLKDEAHTASRESCIAAIARANHNFEVALAMLIQDPEYTEVRPSDDLDTVIREGPWKNFGDEFIATMNIYLRGKYLEPLVDTTYKVPNSPGEIATIIKGIFRGGWREADKLEIIMKNVLELLGQEKTTTEIFSWYQKREHPHYPEFTASPAL